MITHKDVVELKDEEYQTISAQCLFGAGLCVHETEKRDAIIDMIETCGERSSWPIGDLIDSLRQEWKSTAWRKSWRTRLLFLRLMSWSWCYQMRPKFKVLTTDTEKYIERRMWSDGNKGRWKEAIARNWQVHTCHYYTLGLAGTWESTWHARLLPSDLLEIVKEKGAEKNL